MLRRNELRWMLMLTTAYVWAVGCATEGDIPFGEAGATTGTETPSSTVTTSSAGGANAGGANAGGMGTGGDPAACGVVTCEADQACCTTADQPYCHPASCTECCANTMSTTTVTSTSSGFPTTAVTSTSSGFTTTAVSGVGGSFNVSGVGAGFPAGVGGFASTGVSGVGAGFPAGVGGFGSVSAVSGSGGGTPCGSLTCTSGFSCCTPANIPAYCYPTTCTACCIP